jgi:RNA polymerase sigma-70 factor (ECF subfamily)
MAEGERGAEFAAFYRRYYSLALTTATHRVYGFTVAEDVTSEVFRIAWQHHAAGEELTLPWLYGVARNVIGNEYRRSGRSKNLDERLREYEATRDLGNRDDEALDVLRASP